ncbi:MAG TPA: DUF1501 domain-containing protein [Caulobacteraceae bacterium]|jgi:uncharacterized protein (DUF1501 family)|nr:DUF1501 domain-containing protein [Caulobacteraceae bacterium]
MTRTLQTFRMNRRALLGGMAGVSVLFAGRAAFASESGRRKLVVIIARGGLDGLSVSPPHGDANYAALRGAIAIPPPGADGGALKLDETFALHPALPQFWAMTQAGEARIAPAVAIPDRIRSHFEAQDMLENGTAKVYATSTGWLNRALATNGATRAMSVGAQAPLVIRGPVEVASWSPGPELPQGDRVAGILMDLYKDDPLLAPALASGLSNEAMARDAIGKEQVKQNDMKALGVAISRFMTAHDGPDVVALSLDGFDTHANQGSSKGQLANRLAYVDQLFGGLKGGLGPVWSDTAVVMATEFGRTARINGTQGTDHGTASTLLLAGGALKRGGIVGDWPTLADNRLFENRDLAPTLEVRSVFKGLLRDHLGVEKSRLDSVVFPDSQSAPVSDGLI